MVEVFHMTMGDRIKKFRLEAKMTQDDLIAALDSKGASAKRIAISRWENNHSTPATYQVKCLAEIFGTSMDYLVDGIRRSDNEIKPNERAIIEAVRLNPHIAHIIDCAKNMTSQQIETACRVVCNMFAVKDEYHAG
jgi:transcriptional regulator with XRE-family HTH domain